MDNIAHTLVGITIGKAASKTNSKNEPSLLIAAIIGSNFADLDFIWPLIFPSGFGAKLDYLIHHRGFTHLLVAILPIALLSFLSGWIFQKNKREISKPLIWTSIIASFSHLILDFMNDYGLHPFVPFLKTWVYGDFGFIVEPILWLSFLPYIFSASNKKASKMTCLVLTFIILAASWLISRSSIWVSIGITAWSALMFWMQLRRKSPVIAFSAFTAFMIFFYAQSTHIKEQITTHFQETANRQLLHVATTPSPSNPFCWKVIVSSYDQDFYYIQWGSWRVFDWNTHENCRKSGPYGDLPGQPDTSMKADLELSSNTFNLDQSIKISRKEFNRIKQSSCEASAFLKFSRFPFIQKINQKEFLGDLRYDSFSRNSYSKIELTEEKKANECPFDYIPWDSPIHSLFTKHNSD